MQLVMLSGNSLRNRDWIYGAKEQVGNLFAEIYIQDYQHWDSGEPWIDLPHELEVLRQQKLSGEYAVFAKSIGTVLAAQALAKGIIKPKFLLFCGLPLDYIEENYPEFAKVLAASKLPVAVIHNTNDKVGSAQSARAYLGDLGGKMSYRFIETPGNTHNYEDYDLIRGELRRLFAAIG